MSARREGQLTVAGYSFGPATADLLAAIVASLAALALFLSTVQLAINGSPDAFATDVGEIQNALPRWGTIHSTGYPQYTLLGSLFVAGLELVGIPPAAAASLFSTAWGALSAGLLAALIIAFGIRRSVAVVAATLFALSTSIWIDGSLAEVHMMTTALTIASLLAALSFGRHGRRTQLYWLAFLVGQGVTHQRAFAFLLPALGVLVWGQRRVIRSHLPECLLLALTGPLTYLYLPLVDRMGSEWVFGAPNTWDGFWVLVLDTKAERIVYFPASAQMWWRQLKTVIGLLGDDWPWPLWVVALFAMMSRWRPVAGRERVGLNMVWIPYLLVSLIIWEGRVSDALLAVKVPVIAAAAIGLALMADGLWQRSRQAGLGGLLVGVCAAGCLFLDGRPAVLAITRHEGAVANIALAEQLTARRDDQPITLMALWGSDYWQLAYAQAFQGKFPNLRLIDQRAPLDQVVTDGGVLTTLTQTFLFRPIHWWEEKLGPVYLETYAPGVIEIRTEARRSDKRAGRFCVNDELSIESVDLEEDPGGYLLKVQWTAEATPQRDYGVVVQLVSAHPPDQTTDIVDQVNFAHPVEGWYPTTRWQAGQVVQDVYRLSRAANRHPVSIRITAVSTDEDGQRTEGQWLLVGLN